TPNKSSAAPTAASVAQVPYYQMLVQSQAGSALLILGNLDYGREAWYSGGDEILFLRHGLLVKTWNMQPDIIATHLPADSPFRNGLHHLRETTRSSRRLDLPDYRYGIQANTTLAPAGLHAVTILDETRQLLRIDEHVEAPAIAFVADNRYWVDPSDGFVWQSQQTIPGGLTLTLTQLKPYRGRRNQ
ncbi:MAG TPA: YjbF family lipoprotein, partial [Salinisphaeraceae bacterium]|nr:YjbF family lipoprotein [Salinisphaeraceae bacterium]